MKNIKDYFYINRLSLDSKLTDDGRVIVQYSNEEAAQRAFDTLNQWLNDENLEIIAREQYEEYKKLKRQYKMRRLHG